MSFTYPSFLWALLFIAVPIIIHLVNLRRHKIVYFSNVNLLKQVQKQTQRKSKLKQLLILGSRIAMIIALVLAFAKPYIPTANSEKQTANKAVGIYIDNSFSMNAEGSEGKAIENAKQKAYAIVNGSQPNTKFALLTNELSEQQNRFYSKNEVTRLIGEIEENYHSVMLSTIMMRFNSMMENFLLKTDKTVYVVSDFQRYTADIGNMQPDSILTYNFIPVPINNVANLYIDSCWFDAPTHHFNQVEILNVRVVNQSSTDYPQLPVNFYLNDSLKALATIDLEAGEQKVVSMQYTNINRGQQFGRVEISDYPIVYDNNLYLAYNVRSELHALMIEQGLEDNSKHLRALFLNDDFIKLDIERSDRLQISTLSDYSTIILNELQTISSGLSSELKRYVENGGTLVLIPNKKIDTQSYNELLKSVNAAEFEAMDTIAIPISDIAYNDPLFDEVFKDENQKVALPTVDQRYRFGAAQQVAETSILTFADKSSALSLTQFGAGKVYTFAFPVSVDKNEFNQHLLFLPTFYNMVLHSSFTQNLYYVIGRDESFELKLPEQSLSQNLYLKNLQTGNEIIPNITQQRGNTLKVEANGEFNAGFYQTYFGDETINGFAFNYDLKESDLNYYKTSDIEKLAKQAGIEKTSIIDAENSALATAIEELDNGKQLWRLFILIALVFILIEAAIIKFWK